MKTKVEDDDEDEEDLDDVEIDDEMGDEDDYGALNPSLWGEFHPHFPWYRWQ